MGRASMIRSTAALATALGCVAVPGVAFGSGTIQQLSGTISVQKPNGAVRVLSRQSEVVKGDTLNTERDSYAQVKFTDGAIMTIKPNTRIRIDDYAFDEKEAPRDNSTLALLKGGLRMITGLIGKRGNADALKLGTVTATIGIRGTTFTVDDCVNTRCLKRGATRVSATGDKVFAMADAMTDARTALDFPEASADPDEFAAWVNLDRALTDTPGRPFAAIGDPFALMGERIAQAQGGCESANPGDCLAPAVYVGVSDGEVIVSNSAGTANFRAGSFGAVENFSSRPTTLPGDPGLPIYQPPSTFFQNISGSGARNANSQCLAN